MTPSFLAFIVLPTGLLVSTSGALYVQLVLCLFGAAAAVTLTAFGDAVITPSIMFLPFLLWRAWCDRHTANYFRNVPVAGVWLTLTAIWGALTAFVVPRILEGQVEVMVHDRGSSEAGMALFPLRPVSGNITQTGYAFGGALAFLAMRVLLDKPGRLRHFRDAVLLLTSLNCAAAVLGLAEFHLGLPSLLDHVRNAYTVYDSYTLVGTGMMRIQGTFPEASAFAAFTLPLFAFSISLWFNRVRPLYSGALAVSTLLLLAISTSTTAYVGLALYLAVVGATLLGRGLLQHAIPQARLVIAGACVALLLSGALVVFETSTWRHVGDYFDTAVFQKLETSSGESRSSWNHHAWSNVTETYGLGVGLGSARASSFPLVLLSNLGIVGTALYLMFLRYVLRRSSHAPLGASSIPAAARQAVVATLCAGVVSGAVFDLGIAFYAYAAAGTARETSGVEATDE